MAAPRTATVRSLNPELPDESKIIVPESFETDVHKMMQNWYNQGLKTPEQVAQSDQKRKETSMQNEKEYVYDMDFIMKKFMHENNL